MGSSKPDYASAGVPGRYKLGVPMLATSRRLECLSDQRSDEVRVEEHQRRTQLSSSADSDGRWRTIAPSQLQNEPTMRVYDLGLGTKSQR